MRAVEGYSMGGYGAAHLGFKYPETFSDSSASWPGALITPSATVQAGVFDKMFGSDPDYVEANNPFELVRKNADAIRGRTAVRVAVGDQDGLQVRDKAFHELLTELKIEHEYELVPGVAHNGTLFYKTLGAGAFAWYQKAHHRAAAGRGQLAERRGPRFYRLGASALAVDASRAFP